VKVFRCRDSSSGGCNLAQVPITGDWTVDRGAVADPTKWSYQAASGWKFFTRAKDQAGTTLPATGARPTDATDVTAGVAPSQGFANVKWNPQIGRYVMTALSPAAPVGSKIVVRTAPFANGPWNNGTVVNLPANCSSGAPACYSPSVQPQFDDTAKGLLGISYVDLDYQSLPNAGGGSAARQQLRIARFPRSALGL
jgi:hypothetical protein